MKKRMKQLRMRLAMLALLVGMTIPGWAAVTGSYDSSTKTLTFSGTGALTRDVVTAVTGFDQATTYVIGGGVSRISAQALRYLTNIQTLLLSWENDNLQIENDAFLGDNIKSFVCNRPFVYDYGTDENHGLFYRHTSLESITVGYGVFNLPIGTFNGCSGLKTADLSQAQNLTSINDYVFLYCSELTSVTLNDNIATIGRGAFSNCLKLNEINMPSNLRKIGRAAFKSCFALESIEIPENVAFIEELCFNGCINLRTLNIAYGSETLKIGECAFESTAIESFTCRRTFEYESESLTKKGLLSSDLYLREVVLGGTMKTIPHHTFFGCTGLTSVDITDGTWLNSIGEEAFAGCTGIDTLTFPRSNVGIGDKAFQGCSSLINLTIPKFIRSLGAYSFEGCSKLTTLTVEYSQNPLEIGKHAFKNTAMETISLSRSINYAGNDGFAANLNGLGFSVISTLKNVIIEDGVEYISSDEFYYVENVYINNNALVSKSYTESDNLANCFGLVKKLTLGDRVTNIGDHAFCGSKYLEVLNVANTATIINSTAFENCPKLKLQSEWIVDDLYYCYSIDSKILVIRPADEDAEVAIPNYAQYRVGNAAPWGEYADIAEHLVLEGKITSIGSNAFRNFTQLKSVTFKEGCLTSIKDLAFSDCTNLQNFAFPSTLEEIENSAFYGCESLESINLKNTSLATLGSSAFSNCSALKTVLLPSTCNTIGNQVFYNCKNVKEVACYSWPTSVGTDVFDADIKNNNSILFYEPRSGETHPLASYFTTKMSAATYKVCGPSMLYSISGGVLTITSSASEPVSTYDYEKSAYVPWADKASTITQVKVTGPVSRIGSHLFADLPNLTSVNLINTTGLTEIGDHAFEGCAALETFNRPTAIQKFDEYAFYGCSSLDRQLPSDLTTLGMMALAFSGITSANIPEGVTVIGDNAFTGCTNLTSVTFPQGLKKIGYYAFGDCTALTSIDLPEGYTVIDRSAFPGSGLTSLTLKSSVVEIQEYAFSGCEQLTEVITYGDSKLERIGLMAFKNDNKLRRFVMPGRIRMIKDMAFQNCALEAVELSNTLIELADAAFQGCHLTSVTIPTSLSVLSSAFSENALLEKVTVPNNIKKINDYAFYGCSSLSSVILPDSLTYLGSEAFGYCTQLSSIRIPDGISDIYGYTFRGSGLTTVDVPATVKTIGWDAFNGCSNLISVTLPEGLKAIEGEAFQNCTSLTEITLPDSLETIGQNAFAGCSSLQSIYAMPIQTPTIENRNAFDESVYSSTSETVVYTANVGNYNWRYPWSEMNLQNPYEGYAGDNVKYSLEGIDGGYALKLTTEGDGPEYVIYDGMEGELPGWIYPLTRFVPQITRIDMDEKLTGIGDYSLACLSAVKSLSIPASVTSIGTGAFAGMTSLEEIYLNNPVPTANGAGVADDDVYAKAMVYSSAPDTYKKSTIWKKFAADNILPYITGWCGRIYTDEEWAEMSTDEFINEKNGGSVKYTLKGHELLIAENLSTYMWIIGITDLEMQDYTTSSAVPWIKYRDYITDVKFDFYNDRLSRIGDYAFYYLTKVEHIDLPSQLYSIGNYAFTYSGIQSVTFPTGLNTIGNQAFYNTKLQSVEVPGNVASMGYYEFGSNSNLESITFYDGVTKIASNALINCPNLVTVNIPNTVTTIDPSFLKNCTSITSVYIPNSVTSLSGYAFEGCTSLVDVHLPESKQIGYGYNLFKGCTSLQSVVIPSQWTKIISNFFEGCTALESITLPQAISSIGKEAFKGCTSLKTIQVERTTPVALTEENTPFAEWTLGEDGKYDATLIVPIGCVDAYAAAAVWQYFHIQEEGVVNLVDGKPYTNAEDQTCRVLNYTRTFNNADSWQALYIPFGMNYSDWSENFEIARINDVHQWDNDEDGVIDETAVEIVLVKDNIQPNTPYLIKAKEAGTQSITLTETTLSAAEVTPFEVSSWNTNFTFTGTYTGVSGEDMFDNGYYALGGGHLRQAESADNDLSSYRWYMSVTDRNGTPQNLSMVKVVMRNDDGSLTDISEIENSELETRNSSAIYNLSGQRVNKMTKGGVYIQNGKKIFVK